MLRNNSGIILVIEDDHDTRVAIRQALESEGHNVYSATNGSEGLRLLSKISHPSLIILDMVMPLMNGDEFLRIKENDPELKDIPTLVVTSYKEKLDLIGNNNFLMKPFDLDMFVDEINSYFHPAS